MDDITGLAKLARRYKVGLHGEAQGTSLTRYLRLTIPLSSRLLLRFFYCAFPREGWLPDHTI